MSFYFVGKRDEKHLERRVILHRYKHKRGNIVITMDPKTLLLCLLCWNLFTLLLVWVQRTPYPKDRGRVSFTVAKCLQAALLLLLLIRGFSLSPELSWFFILLTVGGSAADALALLILLGEYNNRTAQRYYIVSGMAAAVLLLLYYVVQGQTWYGLLPLTMALQLAYPAYILLMNGRGSPLQTVMGLLYITVILVFAGWSIAEGEAGQGLQFAFHLSLYLLMLLGTAGYMLLSRELSYAELKRVATYDELTGILNRRSFVQRAKAVLASSCGDAAPCTFLLIDIDHFKNINDTYGHDMGDRVLKDFAFKIGQQLRNGDLFGRFGGEEFAVLLHRADEQTSDEIAEGLRRAVWGTALNGTALSYTISIGMVTAQPNFCYSLNTLYKISDAALYQGKQTGRNCVVRGDVPPLLK